MTNANLKLLNLSKTFKNNTQKQNILYVARQNNTQICFFSRGCRFSETGLCLMCNYGKGNFVITKTRLKKALDEIFLNYSKNEEIPMMLFGTNGSIFDNYEMPDDCFEILLDYIKEYEIKNIYFETFYTTVTTEKLQKIKEKLPNANIFIELGFESASKEIREKALLKFIDNDLLVKKVELIHSFGFFVTANILLGIPFLTQKESVEDSLKSIKFLTNKASVDEIVVFPLNIKKNTLLENLDCESTFLLNVLEIIKNLSDDGLEKVIFSWFDETNKNPLISKAPKSCEKCFPYIVDTIKKFNNANKNEKIKIRNSLKKTNCECEKELFKMFKQENNVSLGQRISNALKNFT